MERTISLKKWDPQEPETWIYRRKFYTGLHQENVHIKTSFLKKEIPIHDIPDINWPPTQAFLKYDTIYEDLQDDAVIIVRTNTDINIELAQIPTGPYYRQKSFSCPTSEHCVSDVSFDVLDIYYFDSVQIKVKDYISDDISLNQKLVEKPTVSKKSNNDNAHFSIWTVLPESAHVGRTFEVDIYTENTLHLRTSLVNVYFNTTHVTYVERTNCLKGDLEDISEGKKELFTDVVTNALNPNTQHRMCTLKFKVKSDIDVNETNVYIEYVTIDGELQVVSLQNNFYNPADGVVLSERNTVSLVRSSAKYMWETKHEKFLNTAVLDRQEVDIGVKIWQWQHEFDKLIESEARCISTRTDIILSSNDCKHLKLSGIETAGGNVTIEVFSSDGGGRIAEIPIEIWYPSTIVLNADDDTLNLISQSSVYQKTKLFAFTNFTGSNLETFENVDVTRFVGGDITCNNIAAINCEEFCTVQAHQSGTVVFGYNHPSFSEFELFNITVTDDVVNITQLQVLVVSGEYVNRSETSGNVLTLDVELNQNLSQEGDEATVHIYALFDDDHMSVINITEVDFSNVPTDIAINDGTLTVKPGATSGSKEFNVKWQNVRGTGYVMLSLPPVTSITAHTTFTDLTLPSNPAAERPFERSTESKIYAVYVYFADNTKKDFAHDPRLNATLDAASSSCATLARLQQVWTVNVEPNATCTTITVNVTAFGQHDIVVFNVATLSSLTLTWLPGEDGGSENQMLYRMACSPYYQKARARLSATLSNDVDTRDVTNFARFVSNDTSVIDMNGNILESKQPGMITLTGSYHGVTATQNVQVKNESIGLKRITLSINDDDTDYSFTGVNNSKLDSKVALVFADETRIGPRWFEEFQGNGFEFVFSSDRPEIVDINTEGKLTLYGNYPDWIHVSVTACDETDELRIAANLAPSIIGDVDLGNEYGFQFGDNHIIGSTLTVPIRIYMGGYPLLRASGFDIIIDYDRNQLQIDLDESYIIEDVEVEAGDAYTPLQLSSVVRTTIRPDTNNNVHIADIKFVVLDTNAITMSGDIDLVYYIGDTKSFYKGNIRAGSGSDTVGRRLGEDQTCKVACNNTVSSKQGDWNSDCEFTINDIVEFFEVYQSYVRGATIDYENLDCAAQQKLYDPDGDGKRHRLLDYVYYRDVLLQRTRFIHNYTASGTLYHDKQDELMLTVHLTDKTYSANMAQYTNVSFTVTVCASICENSSTLPAVRIQNQDFEVHQASFHPSAKWVIGSNITVEMNICALDISYECPHSRFRPFVMPNVTVSYSPPSPPLFPSPPSEPPSQPPSLPSPSLPSPSIPDSCSNQ